MSRLGEELRRRWQSPGGARLAAAAWGALASSRVHELGLPDHDGLLDLRGLPAPVDDRETRRSYDVAGISLEDRGGNPPRRLSGIALEQLDLSFAQFDDVCLDDCRIRRCRLDGADLRALGLWLTEVEGSTFVRSDLSHAQLGAWGFGSGDDRPSSRGNSFHRCDFTGATMRRLFCDAGEFVDCVFDETRIEHVEFGSTAFVRCRFSGLLNDVVFQDVGCETGRPDPNPMDDIDFSSAVLRATSFHGLDLEKVELPVGPEYLHFRHYRRVLESAPAELEGDERRMARGLRGYLSVTLRWQRPDQDIGFLNILDLGSDQVEQAFARELLERHQGEVMGEVA